MAVLLYDHRGFGASGGEPRLQINPWIQARGYRAAISFGCSLDEVDTRRVDLWGDSLSGGVALTVSAIDERVAALVVQVPSIGPERPPDDLNGSRFRTLRATLLTGTVESTSEGVPGSMPVVSDDQVRRPSALQPLTAYRWFIEYGGRHGTGWVNDVTRARPMTPVGWHAGLSAPHVTCPTMFVVAPEDEMPGSAPAVARDAYNKVAGPKEWLEVEGGHFGLLYWPGPIFDRSAAAQARFLAAHLPVSAPASRGSSSVVG
jgi:pimeloyl-ACP methyl ester carboxylesterase